MTSRIHTRNITISFVTIIIPLPSKKNPRMTNRIAAIVEKSENSIYSAYYMTYEARFLLHETGIEQ